MTDSPNRRQFINAVSTSLAALVAAPELVAAAQDAARHLGVLLEPGPDGEHRDPRGGPLCLGELVLFVGQPEVQESPFHKVDLVNHVD